MREMRYLDFELLVEPAGPDLYQARVVEAPSGETGPVKFAMPFSDLEVDNFFLRIGRPRRSPVRGEGSMEATAVQDFGERLFDAVFRDDLRLALMTSLGQAESMDAGLRVRLRLSGVPELAELPWEYLYDRSVRRFLALSEWTPLVRYLELQGRIRPLAVTPPLRILVLIAGPIGLPPLDADTEWGKLRTALSDLEKTGMVTIERVPSGTLSDLQKRLRQGEYHVLHYIGHGGFDPQANDGVLVLEGPTGLPQPVSGQDLGALLHDHRTLRLAVLNSCEGARGGREDPYSGTAQSLVYQGIPAVVAMQFEITDSAALEFSHSLYDSVADGYPLDAALAEARKAVRNQPNPVEWGTPVLYLRAPDGRVFDVPAGARQRPPTSASLEEPQATAVFTQRPYDDPDYTAALTAYFTERWDQAADLLAKVVVAYPEDQQAAERLAESRRRRDVARLDATAREAEGGGRWNVVVDTLERIALLDPGTDLSERIKRARSQLERSSLVDEIGQLYAASSWDAVLAAGERLRVLDPSWSDPDGLLRSARNELTEADLAQRYVRALEHLDRGEPGAAGLVLGAIQKEHPGYRDTEALLARLQGSNQDRDLAVIEGQEQSLPAPPTPPVDRSPEQVAGHHGEVPPPSGRGSNLRPARLRGLQLTVLSLCAVLTVLWVSAGVVYQDPSVITGWLASVAPLLGGWWLLRHRTRAGAIALLVLLAYLIVGGFVLMSEDAPTWARALLVLSVAMAFTGWIFALGVIRRR